MRDPETYRAARRNAWHKFRQTVKPKKRTPWARSNVINGTSFRFGTPDALYIGSPSDRSRYMPHQGEREIYRRFLQKNA